MADVLKQMVSHKMLEGFVNVYPDVRVRLPECELSIPRRSREHAERNRASSGCGYMLRVKLKPPVERTAQ